LRKLIVLASVLLLAGCTDGDWAHVMSNAAPSAYPARASDAAATYSSFVAPAARPSTTQKCAAVADERMGDADLQGLEGPLLQQVRDQTYANCMQWAARTTMR